MFQFVQQQFYWIMDLTIKSEIPGADQYVLIHMDLIKWFNNSIISKICTSWRQMSYFPYSFDIKKNPEILGKFCCIGNIQ